MGHTADQEYRHDQDQPQHLKRLQSFGTFSLHCFRKYIPPGVLIGTVTPVGVEMAGGPVDLELGDIAAILVGGEEPVAGGIDADIARRAPARGHILLQASASRSSGRWRTPPRCHGRDCRHRGYLPSAEITSSAVVFFALASSGTVPIDLDLFQGAAVDGVDADFGVGLVIHIKKLAVRRHLDAARARRRHGYPHRASRTA